MRQGEQNWYTLPAAERAELMSQHGKSGMKFAGKVSQVITASTGLDDWEWGVTLKARNPTSYLKDIVYTMRFDESSAIYALFGPFYFGYISCPRPSWWGGDPDRLRRVPGVCGRLRSGRSPGRPHSDLYLERERGRPAMWTCPSMCRSKVDPGLAACWRCGTTADGAAAPGFRRAGEDEEFAGSAMPDVVACYEASDVVEARFLADRLMDEGIPAVADRIDAALGTAGRMQAHCHGAASREASGPILRTRRLTRARAGTIDARQGFQERRRR